MKHTKLVPLALAAVLSTTGFVSFCLPAAAHAQSAVDGAIGGTVEDASGATIPGAQVVIRSNGTNAEQTLTADSSGFYRAIHLQPGAYTVTISAPGFNAYKADAVVVTVGSLTDLTPKLTVGGSNDVIEVSSQGSLVNTTNNDFTATIDLKILNDLPVNNYRWSSYALLTPGVVEGGGFGLLSFRGAPTVLNNITFDGTDDNQAFFSEERGRTRVGYSTAKSSIQEFQVNTSNYSVEYGRSAGGVVNAVTRSGTNQFHGELYFFDRDAGFGAKNPFTTIPTLNAAGTFTPQVFKPKDWRKQQGFGIGGPIIKDKLFFFVAFDKFLRNFPGVGTASAPTQFFANPDSTVATCTGTTTATVNGGVCQLAAELNRIAPVINPTSGVTVTPAVNQVTPAQYTAAATTYRNGIAGLASILGTTPRTGDQNIFFPKLDWQINGKNHLTLEMNRLRWTSPAGIQTQSTVNYGVRSFGDDFVKSTFAIAKLDTSITPTLSNEVRYQYGRDFEYEFNQTPTGYENAVLDNPTSGPAAGYVNPYGIPPNVNITNAFQFGTATFLNRPAYPDERRWQVADTANLVRGHHNLKFGLDYLHTNDLSQNLTAQYGGYSYGGSNFAPFAAYIGDLNQSQGCYQATRATMTSPYVATPASCYTGYQQSFGPLGFEFQTSDYAAFIQDEWKVNPRVSLTLGVRYEYQQQPKAQIANLYEAAAGFSGGSTNVMPDNRTNIGPRVGFAIDVFGDGKTSIRGGVGEFFARLQNSTIYNALAQTGNSNGQLNISVANSTQSFGASSAPIFPRIINPNGFSASAALSSGNVNVVYFDRNFKMPEVLQADLTVEQDLGYNTTLSLTWLASLGRRLPDYVDTNLFPANDSVSYTFAAGGPVGAGTTITIPYYKSAASTSGIGINGVTTSNGRPNAAYGSTTKVFSGVNSNYQGLVVRVEHRTTRNLSFGAHYTWSHSLDYGQNNLTFSATNNLFDPNNLRLEYGNSQQNVPNRVVAYGVYNTPSHFQGILGYLLNNYEIAPSFSGQSGQAYSAGVTGNFSGVFLNSGVVSSTSASAATRPGSTSGGINGTGGTARIPNLSRNTFRFKRALIMDARISKRFRVRDRVDFELLAESFNVFNHLNQTSTSTTAYSLTAGNATTANMLTPNATFGVFNPQTFTGNANSNTVYTPRQVQLGARIQF